MKTATSADNTNTVTAPQAEGNFKCVLSLRDLVVFGIAFVGPTAPYSMFGLATVKSQGHLPLVYLIAMVAMSFTAFSYGRMAAAYPEAGSTYSYAAKALHPVVGFFAGWAMILDYILIPMLSVIFVGLTAQKVWPEIPYPVWVFVTALGITAINLRGIQMTSRANYVMNAINGMGRDRLLPYRLFGYVHPKLGTPIYSVLLMSGIHLAGALILKYTEAAELVNFGAFLGFIAVNLCVIRHYWLRLGQRQGGQLLSHLLLPAIGSGVCVYIWMHLSRFALALGGLWLALGFLYLCLLTRGFKKKFFRFSSRRDSGY